MVFGCGVLYDAEGCDTSLHILKLQRLECLEMQPAILSALVWQSHN